MTYFDQIVRDYILFNWGEFYEAINIYQCGCQAASVVKAEVIEANCTMNFGIIFMVWEDFERVVHHYHRALKQFRRFGDEQGVARC